jgi:hypothetical protein
VEVDAETRRFVDERLPARPAPVARREIR